MRNYNTIHDKDLITLTLNQEVGAKEEMSKRLIQLRILENHNADLAAQVVDLIDEAYFDDQLIFGGESDCLIYDIAAFNDIEIPIEESSDYTSISQWKKRIN